MKLEKLIRELQRRNVRFGNETDKEFFQAYRNWISKVHTLINSINKIPEFKKMIPLYQKYKMENPRGASVIKKHLDEVIDKTDEAVSVIYWLSESDFKK